MRIRWLDRIFNDVMSYGTSVTYDFPKNIIEELCKRNNIAKDTLDWNPLGNGKVDDRSPGGLEAVHRTRSSGSEHNLLASSAYGSKLVLM